MSLSSGNEAKVGDTVQDVSKEVSVTSIGEFVSRHRSTGGATCMWLEAVVIKHSGTLVAKRISPWSN